MRLLFTDPRCANGCYALLLIVAPEAESENADFSALTPALMSRVAPLDPVIGP